MVEQGFAGLSISKVHNGLLYLNIRPNVQVIHPSILHSLFNYT